MNKGLVAGAVVILLIIVVAGAYFLTSGGKGAPMIPYNSTTVAPTTVAQANLTNSNSTISASTTVASSNSSTSYNVELESNATYGTYLANASGYTLYTYSSDVAYSGQSSCRASCKNVWPPFYVANLVLAPGLSASNFNVINSTGTAVSHQLTYKGWPLYRYVQDTKPGMISGNGIAGFTVAKP